MDENWKLTLDSFDSVKYRRIILEALQNSPEAFASSYEEEKDQLLKDTKPGFNPKTRLHLVLLIQVNLSELLLCKRKAN